MNLYMLTRPMIDLHIFDLFLQQKITLDLKGIFAVKSENTILSLQLYSFWYKTLAYIITFVDNRVYVM